MRKIGQFEFPVTTEECKSFKRVVFKQALAMRVLAAARIRIEGTWKAYVDAVPGENHSIEVTAVLENGTQLHENVARELFPMFQGVPYAR